MTLGELLKKKRKEKRMTQECVADLFGWTSQYYARYEKDQIIPTKYNYEKFASFLGISTEKIAKIIDENSGEH